MKVHDETCGMTIESDEAAASVVFQDVRYFFCAERCRDKFVANPERYVEVLEPSVEEDVSDVTHHHHHP